MNTPALTRDPDGTLTVTATQPIAEAVLRRSKAWAREQHYPRVSGSGCTIPPAVASRIDADWSLVLIFRDGNFVRLTGADMAP